MFARKVVELPSLPLRALVYCTCDNEYQLWVNGKLVGQTPVGELADWWRQLDEWDITCPLHSGKNVLAVRARNVGGLAAFILQGEVECLSGEKIGLVTDGTWKVGKEEQPNWHKIGFDDSGWRVAKVIGKPIISPSRFRRTLAMLWLVLQEVKPALVRQLVFPIKVVEAKGVLEPQAVLASDGRLMTVRGVPASLILDFGKELVGYLRLKIMAAQGGTVKLAYGESLNECKSKPYQPVDQYSLKPGAQEWVNKERRAFRYLKVSFEGLGGPVEIDYIGLDFVTYPVKFVGKFECSDELLNEIWEVSRYTCQLCMQDYYEDGIKRDRLIWLGDLRVEELVNFYAFGDRDLLKRCLALMANIQKPNGVIPAAGPHSNGNFADYCAYWVLILCDYYKYTGDLKLVKALYSNLRGQMNWFKQQLDERGLIGRVESLFVDWADIDRGDESTFLECLYYRSLLDASELAKLVGDEGSAKEWLESAARLKEAINQWLWNKELNVYADCRTQKGLSKHISWQTNCMAILCGVAERDWWEKIYEYLTTNPQVEPVTTPYFNFYVLQTLFKIGHAAEGLKLIREYWGDMLRRGATTFWETFDLRWGRDHYKDAFADIRVGLCHGWSSAAEIIYGSGCVERLSLCHGWSSGPGYILPAEIAGIKPLLAGFKKLQVVPQLCDLGWVKAAVPSPYGKIMVEWRINEKLLKGLVNIPKPCKALVGVPKVIGDVNRLIVNGKVIWVKGAFRLPQAWLEKAYEDEQYFYLDIKQPGKYVIELR